jgi:protocatechuate 3,4-dioxygenase beta subunit
LSAVDPPYDWPDYRSTLLRAPKRPLVSLPHGPTERHGPAFGHHAIDPVDSDLTRCGPLGERIIVTGRLLGPDGRPIRDQLVEIWQANSAGRYAHDADQHAAPLDPNFTGAGRCLTDTDGRYRFVTIKPGAYPWGNHRNAWRPAHIHLSVFGRAFPERLVTQMYFPGDPLLAHDPIFLSVRDVRARQQMIARFDFDTTEEGWALGYRFDVMLGSPLT